MPEGSPLVLIVEDDPVVVETLDLYLRHAGYEVAIERSGPAGLARARQPDVAVVLLDWMIPGLNGHEVCRQLRAVSRVPVIMLTARTAEDDRVRALETGAPAAPGNPDAIRAGSLEIDRWRREVRVHGRPVAVTPSEFKLLEAMSRPPGRAFTREELLARAFGPDYDGLDRTIDTHVTNLRRKLEAAGAAGAILTVHGVGYRMASSDDQ